MRLKKKYQDGGKKPGTASRQDSLNAYNAAVELLQALEDQGYNIRTEEPADYVKLEQDAFVRRLLGEFTPEERRVYERDIQNPTRQYNVEVIDKDGRVTQRFVDPKDIYEYYGVLDREEEEDVIRSREKTIGRVNPKLPMSYYDRRIDPQGFITAEYAPPPKDIVEFPYYDPLAVKPYDMLTEEEKAERLRKYGPEKGMRPVKNKITKTVRAQSPALQSSQQSIPISLRRMFPLPPAQNQITATDQRQLAEMLFDERKKGREAVRVMKADQTMDTGHTPDYDVTWDDSRKQWVRRDIPQEEKDRYQKEHKVFRTPRVSF